ncbi:MAG: hypothetical protein AAFV53_05615 [Myxococcota bacterium]
MFLLTLSSLVFAGTVELQTTLPIDVRLDGTDAARTYGASTVQLTDVAAGEHTLTVFRAGVPEDLTVQVPTTGVVTVFISADALRLAAPVITIAPERTEPPKVVFQARGGDSFLVRIDGDDGQLLAPGVELKLDDLPAGPHALEITRPDQLVVWVRGTLTLQPGDQLQVLVEEGRMIQVFGRQGAWKAGK